MSDISVRTAMAMDAPQLLEELRKFDVFFPANRSLIPDDREEALAIVERLIAQGVFMLAVRGSRIIGFIAGTLTPHLFNPKIHVLCELLWWVTPDARGSRAGALLFNEFLEVGKREGVDWIVMTLEAGSPISDESLTKRGFKPMERSFLLEVE